VSTEGKCQRTGAQIGVLMVCHTNLDRSPAAAAVFHSKAEAVGAGACFFVDSASTGGGNPVRTPLVTVVGS
jgi:protein-tyrosine-phosphatase